MAFIWRLLVRWYWPQQRWNYSRALWKERRSNRPRSSRQLRKETVLVVAVESVFCSMRVMRVFSISDCEPWPSVESKLFSCAGSQLGSCLARLGFIQTQACPCWSKNTISSVMQKKPAFSQRILNPSRQTSQRQSWSQKGMSLISFSRRSTLLIYSSPLQTVEQSSLTDVLEKYRTLEMCGEWVMDLISGRRCEAVGLQVCCRRRETYALQVLQSCSVRNCSSYYSMSSRVVLWRRRRLRKGLTLLKRELLLSSMAQTHSLRFI